MLITCGKCGNDVSDKAKRCPKCKTPVKPLAIACPECAKEVSEQDLSGDCPHCGYPLRHLRLSSMAASPIPPAQVPKASALECPNCGCVLPSGIADDGKCPNCGFAMRPERTTGQPAAKGPGKKPARSAEPLATTYNDAKETQASDSKKARPPKSRLRKALDILTVAVLAIFILAGTIFIVLSGDLFGIRSSLRNASNSEETEETLSGSSANMRLWMKHAVSVILDQFPEKSDTTRVESQNR